MSDTPVVDLRDAIEQMEISYEFLISYAGDGVDRQAAQSPTDQVNDYVTKFNAALGDGYDAAGRVADAHPEFDTDHYHAFIDELDDEIEEARTILSLVADQDVITSHVADNLNGMSVFQSVMMKFFFLDELTTHLERETAADGG